MDASSTSLELNDPKARFRAEFFGLVQRMERVLETRPEFGQLPDPSLRFFAPKKKRRISGILYPQDPPPPPTPPTPPPEDSRCTKCLMVFWPCNLWTVALTGVLVTLMMLGYYCYAIHLLRVDEALQANCQFYTRFQPIRKNPQQMITSDGNYKVKTLAHLKWHSGNSFKYQPLYLKEVYKQDKDPLLVVRFDCASFAIDVKQNSSEERNLLTFPWLPKNLTEPNQGGWRQADPVKSVNLSWQEYYSCSTHYVSEKVSTIDGKGTFDDGFQLIITHLTVDVNNSARVSDRAVSC